MSTDAATTEEDRVSILSFDNLEEDYALPGSDTRIHHWLSQQCHFELEEKELPGPYGIGGPGELLSTVLANHRDSSSTISEEGGEAALRADSPLLGFGVDDERTLVDPLHFPSATYVRDLPDYRSPSSRSRSTSTSSSSPRTLGVLSLSRRPSLLRKPSLPLLGELDDESQPQAISSPPPVAPPQPGRSRAHSNTSKSSFHLPTSMQLSHQITPPLTPISPTPFIWRHTRKPNTPPVSSTLASFSFGNSSGGVRTRPHSQLHHGHGPFLHPAHRHPPATPQKIPHTLSRSSSALSLLSLSTNNRNAVYINEMIDIDSDADDLGAEGGESLNVDLGAKSGEDDRLQGRNEEGHHNPLIPPTNTTNTGGVHFNALRSSQVYLGIGTNKKPPTRPPPAPPLIIDEKGGLGGVGVIDEDAIEEKDQLLAGDRSSDGGVYSHQHQHHHRQPHVPPRQHMQFEETDAEHDDSEGEDDKPFMSRWSLTSSISEIPTPGGSGVVATFGASGGGGSGLFGSRKRMSFGGDKIDKTKGADDEKGKVDEEKEKMPKSTEKLGPVEEKEKEKEKSIDKKRGRLVSFISRISSNMMAPPPPTTFQNIPFQNVTRLSSF